MKPLLFLFICLLHLSSFAQTSFPDSLQSAINSPQLSEKQKPALLNRLAEYYRVNKEYTLATETARKSASIAVRNKNYTDATKAYVVLLNSKISAQEFPGLKQLTDTVLLMAKQSNDPIAMAYAYYGQALLFKTLGNSEELVKFCQMALTELDKKPDPFIAAKIYYQLYATNSNWNNEAKVYQYATLATESALKTSDYTLLSNCYNAMSTAHEYKYNEGREEAELDSILYYLQKSESLYTQYPGRVNNYAYGISCINLASYYLKYFKPEDNKAKAQAVYYANRARTVLREAPNSQEVVASSLGILSEYAKRDGRYDEVERYLLEAYEVMLTEQPPYYYTMINVTKALADFYERRDNYAKALKFQKEVTEYNNKNFDQQKAMNAQKLEIQYETEKKNNEVRYLKEREKSQQLQNVLYACVAIASFLCLLFLFRSYYFRLRYSLQREKQLKLEKQDSELQIKFEKEEQARLRAEQQLLEVQQQQLKKEVMANVLQLEHKNQMLHNLKDKLTGGDEVNIQKILKEEMILDNDFEQAKLQIQQVHPDFFQSLNEKAQRKLTLLDLKLCAYLYLQMDTRQIAQLMHIESKSVRMSRYRIKQKLGLDKDDDLNGFLQGLNETARVAKDPGI